MAKRKTTEEFICSATRVHGIKYDYAKVVYTHSKTKVIVTCPEHGDFEQVPNDHLKGKGCSRCAGMLPLEYRVTDTESFIKKSLSIHSSVYNYDNVKYIKTKSKVSILCSIHGEFMQTPNEHLKGAGCPSCAIHGFSTDKPAILYYLKVTTDTGVVLYKVGITNNTVNVRFELADLKKIEIIKQEEFLVGQDAYNKEQEILEQFKEYRYKGSPVLKSGNTELLTKDIYTV